MCALKRKPFISSATEMLITRLKGFCFQFLEIFLSSGQSNSWRRFPVYCMMKSFSMGTGEEA